MIVSKIISKILPEKLVNLCSTNPKEYRRILTESNGDEISVVSIDDMFQLLKDMVVKMMHLTFITLILLLII